MSSSLLCVRMPCSGQALSIRASRRRSAWTVTASERGWDGYASNQHSSANPPDEIAGQNFVIRRGYRIQGPDFVIKRPSEPHYNVEDSHRQIRRNASTQIVPYAKAVPSLRNRLASVLALPGPITQFAVLVDSTNVQHVPEDAVEVLPDDFVLEDDAVEAVQENVLPCSSTGIVWVPSQQPAAGPRAYQPDDSIPPDSSDSGSVSPRRTSRLHFTCNICGTRNHKAVNPRAWTEGTVFARCDGCNIVHKLCDNLNLIDEIVYAREDQEDSIKFAEAVEQMAVDTGLPRMPAVVNDLIVPPGLVVEPDDPINN